MTFPVSYKDPLYDQYEAEFEAKYGMPSGITKAIRTKGEKTNHGQWSAANKATGAATVYQIIPKTQKAFLKTYGVDAYAGPREAAHVAVLHLRDSQERLRKKTKGKATPDELWNHAVREYIGGPDPRQHGKVTAAYVRRAGKGQTAEPPMMAAAGMPAVKTPMQMVNSAIGLPDDDDEDYAMPPMASAMPRQTPSIVPESALVARRKPTLTDDAPMQQPEADPYPGIDIGDITKRMRQRAEELWRIS